MVVEFYSNKVDVTREKNKNQIMIPGYGLNNWKDGYAVSKWVKTTEGACFIKKETGSLT